MPNYFKVFWLVRAILNMQPYFPRTSGPIKFFEQRSAKIILLNLSQIEYFKAEIKCLQKGQSIEKSSPIRNLSLFLNEDGILRIAGTLAHSDLSFDQRHPILLNNKHKLSSLIVFS